MIKPNYYSCGHRKDVAHPVSASELMVGQEQRSAHIIVQLAHLLLVI